MKIAVNREPLKEVLPSERGVKFSILGLNVEIIFLYYD
jgi:hypothetical protein